MSTYDAILVLSYRGDFKNLYFYSVQEVILMCDYIWESLSGKYSQNGVPDQHPHKPGNLLEMKIHGSHLRPTESEILGVRFSNL